MPEVGPLRRPNGGSPDDANESDEDNATGAQLDSSAFRLSVDLGEYFQQPARCFVWVPRAGGRCVRWLARKLRRTAALRSRFCLLCASHILPPDEPLRMLQAGDALSVVPVEHEWQRVFSFRGERPPPPVTPVPTSKSRKRRKTDTTEAESLRPALEPEPTLSCPTETLQTSHCIPSLVEPTVTPAPPISVSAPAIIPQPSEDNELQRVKRRALELLQKVEGTWASQGQGAEGGEDEPDGAGEEKWPPARKRRRRVRRRRAVPATEFELELSAVETESQTVFPQPAASTPVATPVQPPTPTPPATPVQPPLPGPAVLRDAPTPRPPRLVRALDSVRSDRVDRPSDEMLASAAPAPPPPTAVLCS